MTDILNTNWVAQQIKLWSTDVGTLCNGIKNSVQRINKWSLFKPIRSSAKTLGESDNSLVSDYFHQNGAGMQVNIWNGSSARISLITFLDRINESSDNSWEYISPRGSDYKEYFRLNDYIGYTKYKNKSYITGNSDDYIKYTVGLSDVVTKENWDTYTLENNGITGTLKFSDIWLDNISENNLGEYYLIVYATHDTRHFFRVLGKMSDQDTSTLTIESPLQELYENDTNFFGVKRNLKRYYFLGSGAEVSTDWIEMVNTHNGQFPMEYAPSSVIWRYNYHLNIFKKAIAIPITSIEKNYQIENDMIISTVMSIILENTYPYRRNLTFEVQQREDIIPFRYNNVILSTAHDDILLEGVISEDYGKLVFKNCFQTDVIYWDIGNTSTYDGWFRPTLINNNKIEIQFNNILSEVSELTWNSVTSRLTLVEEYLILNFNNQVESTQNIIIKINNHFGHDLTLTPNTSGIYLDKNENNYPFENLSTYQFKIYIPNFSNLDSYDITTNDDDRIKNLS
jgi:hypothetical protein